MLLFLHLDARLLEAVQLLDRIFRLGFADFIYRSLVNMELTDSNTIDNLCTGCNLHNFPLYHHRAFRALQEILRPAAGYPGTVPK